MTRLTGLWAIVFLGLAACASTGPQRAQPSADTDILAVAALRAWSVGEDPAQALTLISRASAASPERPEIAWLHSRICEDAPGCEAESTEARLRKLDPKNGVVWLGVLARAQERGDTRAAEQILEVMSRSERFDVYWTTLVWRLATALGAHTAAESVTPLTKALDDTVEWLSETVAPAFEPVTSACAVDTGRTGAVVTRCEHIARAMLRSDTTLVESLGLGIVQRLARAGATSESNIEERIATLDYRSRTAASIMAMQLEREKLSAELIELMKKLPREQDVTLAVLRWAGQPLTPPAQP
jgi:hypothetical protein